MHDPGIVRERMALIAIPAGRIFAGRDKRSQEEECRDGDYGAVKPGELALHKLTLPCKTKEQQVSGDNHE